MSAIDNSSDALRRKLLADMSNIVFGSFEELISNGIQPHVIKSVWLIIVSKKDPRIKFTFCYN